jgi:hypothetical protein
VAHRRRRSASEPIGRSWSSSGSLVLLATSGIATGRFRDSDILRHVFEAAVRACMEAGLVKGEGFAVDASVIEADASRYHGKAPDEIDWLAPERQTRAVAEFLSSLDDEDSDTDRKLPKGDLADGSLASRPAA